MKIKYIDGKRLRHAVSSGAREVIRHTDHLNRINVFPVPDGDTGSNLASTMHSILRETVFVDRVDKSFESMAEVALYGARGNSGIIFAQFIKGIAVEIGSKERLSTKTFGESVMKGVGHAYKAIMDPVEGTMLTVIREWAKAVYDMRTSTDDFAVLLNEAQIVARKSLDGTPELLAVLKDANVVDSGAKGFVHFMEGILHLINSRGMSAGDHPESEPVHPARQIGGLEADGNSRHKAYCMEILLECLAPEEEDALRAFLSDFGESAIVAGNSKRKRIHIHTDRPFDMFAGITGFGRVIQSKVDDMDMQDRIARQREKRIALVTDSVADLPKALIEKYNITVVPLNIEISGNLYLDKVTIDGNHFRRLAENSNVFPTSSQPSPKAFENVFTFLLSHYESIIGLFVSGALSGTFNSAHNAVELLPEADRCRVKIVDTRLNSAAQGLVVLEAAEMLDAGHQRDSVLMRVEELASDTKIYVSVDSFEYMVRGGRVSPMKGRLARLLNLKPIVSLDGEGRGIAFAKAFSRKSNKRKILKIMEELDRNRGIKRYAVVHHKGEDFAADYAEALERLIGKPPAYIMEVSSAVALSSGERAVGVAAVCERSQRNE